MNYGFINEGLFAFAEAIYFLILFICLTGKGTFSTTGLIKYITFALMFSTFSFWASTYIPFGFHTLVTAIFTIILLSFLLKNNIINSILIFIVIFILLFIIETIASLVLISILGINFSELVSNPQIKFLNSVVCKSIEIIFAISIFIFFRKKVQINFFKKESKGLSILALQIFLMSIFGASISYVVSLGKEIHTYTLLISIIFILYMILAFFDIQERNRLLKIESRLNIEIEHIKNLEDMISVIRREKHDFSNHINTIFALCKTNKSNSLEKIENYIQRLSTNLKSMYRFFNTGNSYVDGLLTLKSNVCFENDIDLKTNFEVQLSNSIVDEIDIATILSNIINNAIDAILSVPDKKGKFIDINHFYKDDKYIINISNNGPVIPHKNIDQVFNNDFTTKNKSFVRGYGLYIVNQCVKKNNGKITVKSTEEKTEFQIEFKGGSENVQSFPISHLKNAEI